jgi:cyclophilin family peptidyl-prolyl cis-trans isomerase
MGIIGQKSSKAALSVTMMLLAVLLTGGCGSKTPSGNESAPSTTGQNEKDAPVQKTGEQPEPKINAALHQSFADATIADAPDGQELPAQTLTGQSVGKVYGKVVELWDTISLESTAGKLIDYRATLQTDLGEIEIALRPDLAPNHVRNFLALAKAGYYDGLVFERTVHEESDAESGVALDYLEAGCPLGTGNPHYGSIGYWMKPEIQDKVQHEEGTVGAWHVQEMESAACKFYITLTKAPVLDGNFTIFGKVTRGLDVARQIARGPHRADAEIADRPEKPVVIRQVKIHTTEVP